MILFGAVLMFSGSSVESRTSEHRGWGTSLTTHRSGNQESVRHLQEELIPQYLLGSYLIVPKTVQRERRVLTPTLRPLLRPRRLCKAPRGRVVLRDFQIS